MMNGPCYEIWARCQIDDFEDVMKACEGLGARLARQDFERSGFVWSDAFYVPMSLPGADLALSRHGAKENPIIKIRISTDQKASVNAALALLSEQGWTEILFLGWDTYHNALKTLAGWQKVLERDERENKKWVEAIRRKHEVN